MVEEGIFTSCAFDSCALVGEVFGTTGEARADPRYRAGVRWESPRVVVAASYGDCKP